MHIPIPRSALPLLSLVAGLSTGVQAATIRLDSTRTYMKAGKLAVSPGDTVCIEPGRRPNQFLGGIHGTAEKPIVITNCPGGRVLIGKDFYYGLALDSVSHVRITGGLDLAFPYGIHVDGTASGSGLGITGLSHHVEIDHLEISGTSFAGIMVKQDYGGKPPLPLFPGLSIHHNFIHETGGEGMYLGETKSPGMLFSDVEVHHNLLLRTGWDGIQTSNMNGVRVHHNVIVDAGVLQVTYQGNGIQVGDNVRNLRIDHNIVLGSNSNSLNALGGGASIDSNWFERPGGAQSLFVDDRSIADTGSLIRIYDNFWHHPTRLAWKVYDLPNRFEITGNRLDPIDTLIVYASGAGPGNVTLTSNVQAVLPDLIFADSAGGDWRLAPTSPYAAWELGLGAAWTSAGIASRSSHPKGPAFPGPSLTVRGVPVRFPQPQGRGVR